MANTMSNPATPEALARQSLSDAWTEIELRPGEKPEKQLHPNFEEAAERLQQAEEALAKGNFGESLKYTVQGRDAAAKARLSEGRPTQALCLFILVLLIIYFGWAVKTLFALQYTCCKPPASVTGVPVTPLAPAVDSSFPGSGTALPESSAVATPTSIPALTPTPTPALCPTAIPLLWQGAIDIPCDESRTDAQAGLDPRVLLWGFLGGVVWCMHGLGTWYSRRRFDKHYVFWYFLNPWIAAALGGTFTLAILSGLINTTPKGGDNSAFLYLVSFVVGLATHDFLKLLIRIVTAVFGDIGSGARAGE